MNLRDFEIRGLSNALGAAAGRGRPALGKTLGFAHDGGCLNFSDEFQLFGTVPILSSAQNAKFAGSAASGE
jgi:hypothetical protein